MHCRCPYLRVRQNLAKLHQCATSLLDYCYWHYLLLTNDHETPNCKHPLFLYITLAKQRPETRTSFPLGKFYKVHYGLIIQKSFVHYILTLFPPWGQEKSILNRKTAITLNFCTFNWQEYKQYRVKNRKAYLIWAISMTITFWLGTIS